MNHKKKLIIGALILILAGIIMLGVATVFGGRSGFYIDNTGLHNLNTEKEAHILEKTKVEEFKNINIEADYADITIIPSDGYYLEYRLSGDSQKPAYRVENQKFVFYEGGEDRWLNFGRLTFLSFYTSVQKGRYYVNLYVPTEQYYTLIDIQNDSGEVKIDTLNAEVLNITSDFGNLNIGTFKGNNLDINMDSGTFHFSEIETDSIIINNSFGKVEGDNLVCDSADISMDSGSLTIEKANILRLNAESDFGDVIFGSIVCKKGEIDLDSGDLELNDADITELTAKNSFGHIKINLLSPLSDYDLDLDTDFGSIDAEGYHSSDSEQNYETHNNKGKSIKASCDSGNIILTGKK